MRFFAGNKNIITVIFARTCSSWIGKDYKWKTEEFRIVLCSEHYSIRPKPPLCFRTFAPTAPFNIASYCPPFYKLNAWKRVRVDSLWQRANARNISLRLFTVAKSHINSVDKTKSYCYTPNPNLHDFFGRQSSLWGFAPFRSLSGVNRRLIQPGFDDG